MKTTLNPFENAKRTAQGTGGGVSPAVIEEMQAEITILGSQLEELAGAYSTTEHKTGRKWIDGKSVYERIVIVNETNIGPDTTTTIATNVDYIDTLVNAMFVVKKGDITGIEAINTFCDADNNLRINMRVKWTDITSAYVVIEYTKPTQE